MRAGAWEPLGAALRDHARGVEGATIVVRIDPGEDHELPAAHFFAGEGALPEVEGRALEAARGRVLDVGAGVGRHAAILRERGVDVVALEPLEEGARRLRARGLVPVERRGIFELLRAPAPPAFDTVLLLMNGTGILGTLGGLDRFLEGAHRILRPGGRILLDSTDLREGAPCLPDGRYVGEVHLQLEYRGIRGEPFPYLYVDPDTLGRRARDRGWETEVLAREPGEEERYLARLRRTE